MKFFKKSSHYCDELLGKKNILIAWNRGMGDVPLGLYALSKEILEKVPGTKLTFITRPDLKDSFTMLGKGEVLVADWKRGKPYEIDPDIASQFDAVIKWPDPTKWVRWQLGTLVPKLKWNPEWDIVEPSLPCIGVHVQTETSYGYEKNWPMEYWLELFERIRKEIGIPILVFGMKPTPPIEGVVDLRGKTTLLQMLSIIKNQCRFLLVPDSGILSLTYYLDVDFPLHIVSLWADPHQGVLKQNVPSPNPSLSHIPLIGKKKNLRTVSVTDAMNALFGKI